MTDLNWRNESSFSRGETDRTPKSWALDAGSLKLIVHRHIHYPGAWLLSVRGMDAIDLRGAEVAGGRGRKGRGGRYRHRRSSYCTTGSGGRMTYQPLQSEDATLKTAMDSDRNCKGVVGRIFGHRYEACYSVGAPTVKMADMNNVFSMVFSSDMAGVIAASRPKTYHGHVCVRCGVRAAASLSDQVGRTQ